jgi:2-phospho-L-lactate guanylyltransferase
MAQDWTAVIPVKRLSVAKSRLRGAVPAARHAELALAMVRDTATAVLATPAIGELLVVTDDPEAAAAATVLGARVVADRPGADLNAAMRYGSDDVAGLTRRRAVLAGDLPALQPDQLDAALAAAADAARAAAAARPGAARTAAARRSFVADAAGSGTVLLAAPPGQRLDPHFGIGSAEAHARSGATPLTGGWPGLRQDVDTPADLAVVLALGAGRYTCELLRDLGLTASCAPAAGAR